MNRRPMSSTLFPYTTLFRSSHGHGFENCGPSRIAGVVATVATATAEQSGPFEIISRDLQEIIRSEEHTSELQSLRHLVCRLLLEKKNVHDAEDKLPEAEFLV